MASLYTTADRDAVKAAIVKLATGERVASVAIAGRVVSYAPADLPALKTLLAEIVAEIDADTNGRRTRSRIAIVSKGY